MRRRRKLWIILLAAPLVLLGAATIYWWIAVARLRDGFAAWVAERQAVGWTEHNEAPVRGGWPLAAKLTIPGLVLAGRSPEIPGGMTWSADKVTLRVALAQPQKLEIAAGGRQKLRLADGPEVPYAAERLRLVMPLQAQRWPQFADVSVLNLHADTPFGGDARVGSLLLHLRLQPSAQSGESDLLFSCRAEKISPPPGIGRPLGPRIASLQVEGSLNGPLPVSGTLAEQAASWRDRGGSLEVHHLALVWGPLDLTGSATLALDDQLQPMGAGSARLVGYAETLDALAEHAVITRSAATAAKAVLSLLANTPDDGGPPSVEVPLTLQYRTLSMRQVPLLRLPELDWP